MKSIKMGNNTIEEHIAKFKMLVTTSDLDSNSPAIVDYFCDSLSIPYSKKFLTLRICPKPSKSGTIGHKRLITISKECNAS